MWEFFTSGLTRLFRSFLTKTLALQLAESIKEGNDVVARAKTGSGKAFAYLLPLLQKLFTAGCTSRTSGCSGFHTCLYTKMLVSWSTSVSIPRRCQCLLMSATSSGDVEKLKKLVLHNPLILTLPEVGNIKDEIIPKNVQQFWISCGGRDKLLHVLALLKLKLVQKKVLIFTNTIDMGYRSKLFLEKFGVKSTVLNSELPQNCRLHILEEFNAGLFDYLIATDDSETK
ncbi:DEAD-box ATP-dependent RNA helicase 16-like [Juglans microcarpa x Juglans regia]|uniref:DEAD-box ATP-dependent RNA helicase 16-like n=1 Tax=Juglans microcarpa x Juglans regia TaxID=2249226 RepID=UPI001B7DAAD6|nr:DEAD-box ATP-dependent RNA helicase 16-like [Juglans microcarpa x Juglans regia]